MTPPPCKNCADRVIGCHGLCKTYNDWVLLHQHEVDMEKLTMPPIINRSQFVGTSPKPGTRKKPRRLKRKQR